MSLYIIYTIFEHFWGDAQGRYGHGHASESKERLYTLKKTFCHILHSPPAVFGPKKPPKMTETPKEDSFITISQQIIDKETLIWFKIAKNNRFRYIGEFEVKNGAICWHEFPEFYPNLFFLNVKAILLTYLYFVTFFACSIEQAKKVGPFPTQSLNNLKKTSRKITKFTL